MNTKHDPSVRHILERSPATSRGALIANSGPMSPPQMRAMWAKRKDPAAASTPPAQKAPTPPPRNFIPVPRVPIPGYEPKPPTSGGASEFIPVGRAEPTPPRDPRQDIWDRINRIRQGLPPDPPPEPRPPAMPLGTYPNTITVTREEALTQLRRSGQLPSQTGRNALPPDHSIWRGMQPGGKPPPGIWSGGKNPDPALKKKRPRGGRINNRAAAAIHFLEQFR